MKVIGIGNTAEVIEYSHNKVCKLFYKGYPTQAIEREYANARVVYNLGIPVPQAYDMISLNERFGIIYDKLEGDTLLKLLLGKPDITQMMLKFATIHKTLLSQHVENVLSYKEFLRCCVFNGGNKEVLNQIQSLPEGNCLCHGDFHPGNVWVSSNGEWFVIDFMNVCCGPWQYDVARTYLLIAEGNVPENIPNRDEIRSMQQQLAQLYLQYIEVTLDELEEFITVIRIGRTYES